MFSLKCKAGFTLMELTIVAVLIAILAMITVQFWRWFSPCVNELIARAHILCEAKIVMESFAKDFADVNVNSLSIYDDGQRLCIDSDGDSTDVNDIYYFKGSEDEPNTLQRQQGLTGPKITIAECVSEFKAEEESPQNYKVTLEFGSKGAIRKLVFYLKSPEE